MDTKELNNLIQKQFGLEPIDFSEPTEINALMRQALAEAYSKEGFRKYLENAISKLTVNSAYKSDNWESVLVRKGGILFLKQLLDVSKTCYVDYVKIKKIANK